MDCPAGFLCLNSQTLGLIIAILLLVIGYNTVNKKNELSSIETQKDDKLNQLEMKINQMEKVNMVDMESTLSGRDSPVFVVPTTNSVVVNKDYERLVNPLLPPERSYNTTYRVPVNIPTRGVAQNYQQVGVINDGDKILPIYGRPRWPGASKWNYYTSTDGFQSVKLPVFAKNRDCQDTNGCDELYDGDKVEIPQYGKGRDFDVSIYRLDQPYYIPHI